MTPRTEARLWLAQRLSAIVLALCVAVHLATMIYAVQGGLSAREILDRTQHSTAWAGFYGLFVVAAAVHAPIGLRNVAAEWLSWRGRAADAACVAAAMIVLAFGLRAVLAVTR